MSYTHQLIHFHDVVMLKMSIKMDENLNNSSKHHQKPKAG